MEAPSYWEETSNHHVKFESGASSSTEGSSLAYKEDQSIFHYCDGNLNFATVATSEDDEYGFHKKKVSRDPMSHRIIEKRRRDRMNNCLADLSRLIPAEYLKKGRGRIEKTEIIEMAIRHMKHLQSHACRHGDQCNGGGGATGGGGAATGASAGADLSQQTSPEESSEPPPSGGGGGGGTGGPIVLEHYRLGYQECLSEAMHFLVEVEGFFAGDPLCVQLINHLQRHCERILKGDRLNYPRTHLGETTSSSGSSCGSGRGRTTATAGGGTGGGGGGCNSSGGLGSSGLGSASASGSSPGSCSDSGRLEPAPHPPREVGPGRRSGGGGGGASLASLASLGRHEEMQANGGAGCYDEPPPPGHQQPLGSQLRDMLTGAQTQDRRCLGEVLTCNVGSSSMQSRQMGGVGSAPPGSSVIHGVAPPPAHPQSQFKHHQHHQHHHAPPPPMAHPLMQPYAAASPGPVPSDGTPVSLYKFKNNIKQRFSAEHVHGGAETPGAAAVASYAKRRRFACDTDDAMCGAANGGGLLSLSVRRRDSETCSVPSPPASPPPPRGAYGPGLPGGPGVVRSPSPASSPAPNNFSQAPSGAAPPPLAYPGSPPRPVPVFALHARGAYYMPLTLDSEVLAPYVDCACEGGATAADAGSGPVALHPITISVNFTRAPFVCPRMAVPRHPGTWKTDPGTPWKTEPGTFGAPRWPECAPDRG